jgi:hypothetical protein
MFEKQFYTILPHAQTNERIEDLLQKRGLSHRIVTNETKFDENFDKEIDYSNIKDYDQLIEKSKNYLKDALSE